MKEGASKMKNIISVKAIAGAIIFILLVSFGGCKKQAKCGCGKDTVITLTDAQVMVTYNAQMNTAIFYTIYSANSTYYFCNPSQWMDSLQKLNTKEYLLLSGKCYYECNYLMQAANYPYLSPVYQVEVTSLKEDSYGKK